MKLLLPYECHIRHDTVADCLSKVDSSLFRQISSSEKVDLQDVVQGADGVSAIMHGRKMNGEALPHSDCISRRLNSRTSDSSIGEPNSQNLVAQESDKEQPSDETQTTPVDSYPQDVSSDEPLPEISAQETESLLAMPPSPYIQPPVTTGASSTPSTDPATPPPPSFPPPYPPQGSQEWGPPSGQDIFPSTGYPSSYSMDASSYRSPSLAPPMPPGYNPFNVPSQHDVSMDYHLEVPSPIIRSPYDTSPYHVGISTSMHGLPSSRHNPYLYRTHMMSRDHFNMRNNEMMYPGTPNINSDWAWQQGSQFPSIMHHHTVQSQSRSNPSMQQAPTSRVQVLQQVSNPASQHHTTSDQSPLGPGSDTTKQQWQDHAKERTLDKTNAQSRNTRGDYKAVVGKSEHTQMFDSLKRPLPDWSGCIEGTKPHLAKRKHLLSVDCGKLTISHAVYIYATVIRYISKKTSHARAHSTDLLFLCPLVHLPSNSPGFLLFGFHACVLCAKAS